LAKVLEPQSTGRRRETVKRKIDKAKPQISNGVRKTAAESRSLADAFDDLRRVRGDEEPIEEAPRIDRPNGFLVVLNPFS
jgi:hypothetical protein